MGATTKQLREQAALNIREFVTDMVQGRPVTDCVGVRPLMAMLRQRGRSAFLELAIYQLIRDGVFEPIERTEVKFLDEVVYLTHAFRTELLGEGYEKRIYPGQAGEGGSDGVR